MQAKIHLRRQMSSLAVLCAGGFRSSIGTSILERQGFARITNVVGGMAAWKSAGLEVAT